MANLVPRELPRRDGEIRGSALPAIRTALAGPQPEPHESLSLRHYLELLFRRKWLLLAVAGGFSAIIATNVATTTPLYRATAVLEFDPTTKLVPYEDIAQPVDNDYLPTQVRKITSRALALQVYDQLHLGTDPAYRRRVSHGIFLNALEDGKRLLRGMFDSDDDDDPAGRAPGQATVGVGGLLSQISAQQPRHSNLIEITFSHPDPVFAAKVVNTIAQQFIELDIQGRFQAVNKATRVLQVQLEDLRIKLQNAEKAVIEYGRTHDIVDVQEGDSLTRRRFEDLVTGVSEAQRQMAAELARWGQLRSARVDDFPASLVNEEIRALTTKQSDLDAQLANLRSRFGPNWPALRELEAERGAVSRELAGAKQRAIAGAGAAYREAEARYQQLNAQLQGQRTAVDTLNENMVEFELLRREADTNRKLYEGLLQRLREASVAAGLKSTDIRIIEEARPPSSPSSPNKTQSLLLALVVGLCLGIGAAFAAEGLDNTVSTAEEIEKVIRLPALGVVPTLAGNKPLRAWRSKLRRRLKRQESGPMVAFRNSAPTSQRAWEAYRMVRTSILLSHSGKPPQTLLFSSALPSEGKSTTAVNVAIALSQTGAKTVIVDLDLRKPSLGDLFGVQRMEGMSTFLSGNSDLSPYIHDTPYPNLFVIPSGPPAPNPAELIGSERMGIALQLLSEYFTHIVFDTPPALELSDALVLAPQVDGVVLVVLGNVVPRETVRRTAARFHHVGGKILGAILNDVDFRVATYGYYYGAYGDYYSSYYAPRTTAAVEAHKGGAATRPRPPSPASRRRQ